MRCSGAVVLLSLNILINFDFLSAPIRSGLFFCGPCHERNTAERHAGQLPRPDAVGAEDKGASGIACRSAAGVAAAKSSSAPATADNGREQYGNIEEEKTA